MAFDIDKLARAAEFSFELRSMGFVRCRSLTSDLNSQARQRLKAPEAEGKELARWLLGEMAKRPKVKNFKESDLIDGERLTSEQLAVVTDQELESFSEQVLQKNRYLVKAHKGEELKRLEGQSASEFLFHAIEHRAKEEKARFDRIIQSAAKPLFAESTLDSIKRSLTASNNFEELIKQYSGSSALDSIKKSIAASSQIADLGNQHTSDASLAGKLLSQALPTPQLLNLPSMHFPKNLIFETNQILENLSDQIQGMRPLVTQGAELIRSMNETALRMQADYIANAARTDRQSRNATWVAVVSLIVSAIGLLASSWFSYQSYTDGKATGVEGKSQSKVFEKLTKDLMAAQHDDRLVLTKALADLKQTVPVGKK